MRAGIETHRAKVDESDAKIGIRWLLLNQIQIAFVDLEDETFRIGPVRIIGQRKYGDFASAYFPIVDRKAAECRSFLVLLVVEVRIVRNSFAPMIPGVIVGARDQVVSGPFH